jgi:hypothetical protein
MDADQENLRHLRMIEYCLEASTGGRTIKEDKNPFRLQSRKQSTTINETGESILLTYPPVRKLLALHYVLRSQWCLTN